MEGALERVQLHDLLLRVEQLQGEILRCEQTPAFPIAERRGRDGLAGGIRPGYGQGFVDVQHPPAGLGAVPVEHPVGEIGGLLDLVDHQSRPQGVDRAGAHEDGIARHHIQVMRVVQDRPAADGLLECIPARAGFEPRDDLPVRRGFEEIPGLRLAILAGTFQFLRLLVVWMDLQGQPLVAIQQLDQEGKAAVNFDVLAYMAPGMALLFLMYTVSYGGRSILAERSQGTLPRLLVSPTSTAQVLGGKVLGIFFTGIAQVGILILASSIFFGVRWGDTAGLVALILATVFGATGWGLLITAIARTPAQVANTGTALMLIFGILGGSFINLEQMPPFVQSISKITPNAWGLDGFTTLALGGTLPSLMEPITALFMMGALLFTVAVVLFNRTGIMQK